MAANPDMVPTCLTDCMSDPSTADTCLSTCFSDLGLSGECSDCVSWMLGCTMTECQSECAGSADPEACNSCSASKCGDEMAACYGEMDGGSGPGAGSFSGEGLCMNPEDGEVMQSNPYMNSSCAQQCFSADDQAYCVGECLFTKGLSEDCAFCMGDLVACSTEYCLTECMGAGPECQECTNVACPEITEACFEP